MLEVVKSEWVVLTNHSAFHTSARGMILPGLATNPHNPSPTVNFYLIDILQFSEDVRVVRVETYCAKCLSAAKNKIPFGSKFTCELKQPSHPSHPSLFL